MLLTLGESRWPQETAYAGVNDARTGLREGRGCRDLALPSTNFRSPAGTWPRGHILSATGPPFCPGASSAVHSLLTSSVVSAFPVVQDKWLFAQYCLLLADSV